MTTARISAVINTLNEEQNLPYALRSVKSWTYEIIVVDMHSEDRTVEIAEKHGARVYFHSRLSYADPARAYAIGKALGDWILILDADEIIPAKLSRRLVTLSSSGSGAAFDAVRIPFVNYLLGAPLQHTGWGPRQDTHIRFFKRGYVNATGKIHNYLEPISTARVLDLSDEVDCGIVHFNYCDVFHFLEKLNRYTTIEARFAIDQGKLVSKCSTLLRSAREFGSRYIKARGYRDGWRGFYLSAFMAFYRFVIGAKTEELRRNGTREHILYMYQSEAENLLKEYEDQSVSD